MRSTTRIPLKACSIGKLAPLSLLEFEEGTSIRHVARSCQGEGCYPSCGSDPLITGRFRGEARCCLTHLHLDGGLSPPSITTCTAPTPADHPLQLDRNLMCSPQTGGRMAAVGWNGELAGTWDYFARREASRAMKANANATASRTMVERMSIPTAPPAHQ